MGKRTLRVYYAGHLANMGDQLNIHIIKACFGYDIARHKSLVSDMCAIGSCLSGVTFSDELSHRMVQYISGMIFPTIYVWGTGFLNETDGKRPFFRKNTILCAVRGCLTKKRLEKTLDRNLDIPTADGGLLASELLPSKVEKVNAVGIIPHFRELDNPCFQMLADRLPNSKLINVTEEPLSVIHDIASCDSIISSSLHGLIVADSLGIPNRHLIASEAPLGDGFKFRDYYSAFDVPYNPLTENQVGDITLYDIVDQYKISTAAVQTKKEALLKAFPFKTLIPN